MVTEEISTVKKARLDGSQAWKRTCQAELLYLTKISFKNEGEIKIIHDKHKLKQSWPLSQHCWRYLDEYYKQKRKGYTTVRA